MGQKKKPSRKEKKKKPKFFQIVLATEAACRVVVSFESSRCPFRFVLCFIYLFFFGKPHFESSTFLDLCMRACVRALSSSSSPFGRWRWRGVAWRGVALAQRLINT